MVAVVGENGAGKTTLVKLLAKLYTPTSGRILIDDVDLARIDSAQWRERLAGAFQDFFRFEFQAGQTIGIGDLPRLDVEPALVAAAGPGRARVMSSSPCRAACARNSGRPGRTASTSPTASGRSWRSPAGSCATSRWSWRWTSRRPRSTPRPSISSSSATPAGRGKPGRNGSMTILVSHRFSTVRMADLIVVLDGARVAEVGSHDELMARGGRYAELYRIQAKAYA